MPTDSLTPPATPASGGASTTASTPAPTHSPIDIDPLYARNPGTVKSDTPTAPEISQASASQAGGESGQAAHATLSGYSAQTQTASPDAMSANKLNEITSRASPLMQRARAEGLLTAGRRGLENSSIAAGAAEGAMVDRAAPLAMQDATVNANQELTNQAAVNRASEFSAQQTNAGELANAQSQNELNSLNAQLATSVSQGNAQQANQIKAQIAELQANTNMANTQAQNEMRGKVLDQNAELNRQFMAGTQANDLATIQGRYGQLIAANTSAASLYQSYFDSIAQVMSNNSIPPARVAQSVNIQQSMLDAGLRIVDSMNSLDLGAFQLPGVATSGTGSGTVLSPTAGGGAAAPTGAPGTTAPPPAPGTPIPTPAGPTIPAAPTGPTARGTLTGNRGSLLSQRVAEIKARQAAGG